MHILSASVMCFSFREMLAVVCILIGVVSVGGCVGKGRPWEHNDRIPHGIHPKSYDLHVYPSLKEGTFNGTVVIHVKVSNPQHYIPIHTKNLNITSAKISQDDIEFEVLEAFEYPKHEFFIIKTKEPLVNSINVKLHFTGMMNSKPEGFYVTAGELANGTGRRFAATRFEPRYAREAFPCFDESDLKAKFKISVVRPKRHYIALSNMNIDKETPGPEPGEVTVTFKETPPMSTYLVNYIIGEFDHVGSSFVDNMGHSLELKVYSSPMQLINTKFAKKAAATITEFLANYIGIPYPLPKLDVISLPNFSPLIEGNWGLITVLDYLVLYNDKEESALHRGMVASFLCDSIAQQWIGNLVTPKHEEKKTWLFDGLMKLIGKKGVQQLSDLQDWTLFLSHLEIFEFMFAESLSKLQLANAPTALQMNTRGSMIMRMIEGFLGENKFKEGVEKFLRAHKYSTATIRQLCGHLRKESRYMDVERFIHPWMETSGYPVIQVRKNPYDWILSQTVYGASIVYHGNSSIIRTPSSYDIPIYYTIDESDPVWVWLSRKERSVKIPRKFHNSLINLNYMRTGLYRVNYDMETWREYINILNKNHEDLHYIHRTTLIEDVFFLALAGEVEFETALDMVMYLPKEEKTLPVIIVKFIFKLIDKLLVSETVRKGFNHYAETLFGNSQGEIRTAPETFKNLKQGMQDKNEEGNALWERYLKETNPLHRQNLLNKLTAIEEPKILNKYIELAKKETSIKPEEFLQMLRLISNNVVGNSVVWDFMRKEWPYLVQRCHSILEELENLFQQVSKDFTSVPLKELEAFLEENPDVGSKTGFRKTALDRIKSNTHWFEKYEEAIREWLIKHNYIVES